MSDLTNRALAVIAGVAIIISLGGLLFSGKPTIFGFAGGSANVSFNLTEELSVSVTGAVNFESGRVYANASSAILDSNQGAVYNWTNVTMPGPAARLTPMVFDSNRNKAVIFGGATYTPTSTYGDTWEYNGTAWNSISTAHSPSARIYHGLAFDSKRNVVVLFGGFNGSILGDTWEYNGTDWSQVSTAHSPPALYLDALTYDSNRNITVLFGGNTGVGEFNDTWEYNGTDWKNVTVPGPSGRETTLTFDSNRNKVVLFGGTAGGVSYSDTWEYDGSAWTQIITPTNPSPGRITFYTFDPVKKQVVMFGGMYVTGPTNYPIQDMWTYDGTTWTNLSLSSSAPSGRIAPQVYDTSRNKIVLFGGTPDANTAEYNDTWEFNYAGTGGAVNGTWSFPTQYIYVENDGTVNESVNVTSDKNAASFLGGTSPSYQIEGVATQSGACAGTFQSSYFDLLMTQQSICSLLQYDTSAHQFETPIKLVIPSDAAPGSRNSVITFSVTKV